MILSDNQIEYIETNLKFYGIESETLREDVVDHICTYIESKDTGSFDELYAEALEKFGGCFTIKNIQNETRQQLYA